MRSNNRYVYNDCWQKALLYVISRKILQLFFQESHALPLHSAVWPMISKKKKSNSSAFLGPVDRRNTFFPSLPLFFQDVLPNSDRHHLNMILFFFFLFWQLCAHLSFPSSVYNGALYRLSVSINGGPFYAVRRNPFFATPPEKDWSIVARKKKQQHERWISSRALYCCKVLGIFFR